MNNRRKQIKLYTLAYNLDKELQRALWLYKHGSTRAARVIAKRYLATNWFPYFDENIEVAKSLVANDLDTTKKVMGNIYVYAIAGTMHSLEKYANLKTYAQNSYADLLRMLKW